MKPNSANLKRKAEAKEHYEKVSIEVSELERLYWDEKYSLAKLARHYKIAPNKVSEIMKVNKIGMRKPGNPHYDAGNNECSPAEQKRRDAKHELNIYERLIYG